MRLKISLLLTFVMLLNLRVLAQESAPRKVDNVVLKDLRGKPALIPYWGKKNLLIFYIDPDRAGQSQLFTDWLEEGRRVAGKNIVGLGIINMKDAPFTPLPLARLIARKRTEKSGAVVLVDDSQILSSEWDLGKCDNKFTAIMVNRAGEILFFRKGEYSQEDIDEFMLVLEGLR